MSMSKHKISPDQNLVIRNCFQYFGVKQGHW